MSTTIQLTRANGQGTVPVTYSGADPADPGPAGTLLKMLLAQCAGDEATLKPLLSKSSTSITRGDFSPTKVEINLETPQADGETFVIPGHLRDNGEGPDMQFVVIKEDGGWKVDMSATIDRMMSGLGLNQVMEQLADGMKQVMEGVADGMKQAFEGMGGTTEDCSSDEDGKPKTEDEKPEK